MTSAASTPPSWTGWATSSATRWSGPCRAGTSPGAARRLTSGCSWRPQKLLRLAAAGHGALLVVDDVHEADQGSLRLLHYLARCAVGERVLLLLAHRPDTDAGMREVLGSLVARGVGGVLEVRPLDHSATHRLAAQRFPSLDEATLQRICDVSAGLPFTVLEMGRAAESGQPPTVDSVLPLPIQRTFQRVALLGTTFTTDELLAVAGVPEEVAYRHLDTALGALVVEPEDAGTGSGTPWSVRRFCRPCPSRNRPRLGSRSPSSWPRSVPPPPAWHTSCWPRASPRAPYRS